MHLSELWCIKLEIPYAVKLDSGGYSATFFFCHIFFPLVLVGCRRSLWCSLVHDTFSWWEQPLCSKSWDEVFPLPLDKGGIHLIHKWSLLQKKAVCFLGWREKGWKGYGCLFCFVFFFLESNSMIKTLV